MPGCQELFQQAFQEYTGYQRVLFPFGCEKYSLPSWKSRRIILIFGGKLLTRGCGEAAFSCPQPSVSGAVSGGEAVPWCCKDTHPSVNFTSERICIKVSLKHTPQLAILLHVRCESKNKCVKHQTQGMKSKSESHVSKQSIILNPGPSMYGSISVCFSFDPQYFLQARNQKIFSSYKCQEVGKPVLQIAGILCVSSSLMST